MPRSSATRLDDEAVHVEDVVAVVGDARLRAIPAARRVAPAGARPVRVPSGSLPPAGESAEACATSLVSSTMQTKRRAAAATIFSRVRAAPPPLISSQASVGFVGAIDIEPEVVDLVQIEQRHARAAASSPSSPASWRPRRRVREAATSELIDERIHGASRCRHRAPCRPRRIERRGRRELLLLLLRIAHRSLVACFQAPETTVPAFAGTVSKLFGVGEQVRISLADHRRVTSSSRPFSWPSSWLSP